MGTLLIRAGHVYDGVADRATEKGFVALDGDTIAAVGRQADLGSDTAARYEQVIDLGDGATVLPGLINMHTHMSFTGGDNVFHDAVNDTDTVRMIRIVENLRASLLSGVTTVRDCGTLPHLALPVRDSVERGLLPGPRIVASGAITSTGGHCFYCATEVDDEASMRKAVRAHAKRGVDFIKLFSTGGNLTPGTNSLEAQFTEREMCAATEEARRLGRRTSSHAHGTPGVRNSIKARVTTIEHCSFQTAKGIGWEEDLAAEVADSGIFVCHTIFRGVGKHANDPGFDFTANHERYLAVLKERQGLTRRLADKGVRLVAGNDAGVSYCGFADFPGDLVLTAEGCGFSAAEVLRSATSVAADALGRPELGVLAPGKVADLLAVEGNPLADIHDIERTRMVVARGKVVRAAA
ncbi:MAG: amidohydrolase family protein [Ectothiorhodospiraceae bacterium]|nr:amidohydrolase family protein [Chromatiales bacterium]MCP5157059.1 amidohydrolase family protein [Ectothiorhodospiraceae bacterium]